MPKNNDLDCSSERQADERHEKYVKMNPTASSISQDRTEFYFFPKIWASCCKCQYSQWP